MSSQMPAAALFGLVLGSAGACESRLALVEPHFRSGRLRTSERQIALTVKDLAFPASLFSARRFGKRRARRRFLTGPGLMDLQDLSLDMDGGKLAGDDQAAPRGGRRLARRPSRLRRPRA